jgi:hypothetical protein
LLSSRPVQKYSTEKRRIDVADVGCKAKSNKQDYAGLAGLLSPRGRTLWDPEILNGTETLTSIEAAWVIRLSFDLVAT